MPLLMHLAAQAAAEYTGMAGGAAGATGQGQPLTPDQLLDRITSADPVAVALVVLGLLVVVALFRTRGYRS